MFRGAVPRARRRMPARTVGCEDWGGAAWCKLEGGRLVLLRVLSRAGTIRVTWMNRGCIGHFTYLDIGKVGSIPGAI